MEQLQIRKNRIRRWMAAVLLSLCLILTLLPVEYYGFTISQTNDVNVTTQQEILSFSELSSDVTNQNVGIGTPLTALQLPNQLTAVCRFFKEEAPANTEMTETPNSETTETPNSETTETPNSETTETPNSETTETPNSETTETPNSETTETPNSETTETPNSETTETLNSETADTSDTETVPEQDHKPSKEDNPEVPTETTTVKPIETDTPNETTQNNTSDEHISAETTTVSIQKYRFFSAAFLI